MMRFRVEHVVSREEAEGYLWLAPRLPATKQGFLAALRAAVKWHGDSDSGGAMWDDVTEAIEAEHAEQHSLCGGPEFCERPTERGATIERLMLNYWEGND